MIRYSVEMYGVSYSQHWHLLVRGQLGKFTSDEMLLSKASLYSGKAETFGLVSIGS